jgi:protein ImuB
VRWFLALHIPDFPLVAAARCLDATTRARPCAVLEPPTRRRTREKLPLLALNQAARDAGIAAGWPLGRALVRCPDLTVLERDRAGESELGHWLVNQGERAAAELEWTRPDTVIVNLTARPDAEHYAFTPDAPDGPEIRWTKAATPDLADLAVRVEALHRHTVGRVEIVKLPIQALVLLGAQAQDLELVELWGLRTLGDLLRLPKPSLVSRLGPQAKQWLELLQGKTSRVLLYHQKVEKITEKTDFENIHETIASSDRIKFILQALNSELLEAFIGLGRWWGGGA